MMKCNWEEFKEWLIPKLVPETTPHARRYTEALIMSRSFRDAERRILELDEEFDLPVLSDFYILVDIFERMNSCKFVVD